VLQRVAIHATAEVSPHAIIGDGTRIWNEAQVREGVRIGRGDCILAKGGYIDPDVVVGDRVKLHTRVSVFKGSRVGSGVFIGPHSCLLNDKQSRATTLEGRLKTEADWVVSGVVFEDGASIGGGCTILPGVSIGRFAMVGAGAVVTCNVPDRRLVIGNPARLIGYVRECAARLLEDGTCSACGRTQHLGSSDR
jgi:UDP-2-acetamido-3-amino-2,3-dideoxy-glucuronate N-acetyltransferase